VFGEKHSCGPLGVKCVHTPTDIVRRYIAKKITNLDQQKKRSNSKQKAFIVGASNRISRDVRSNFKTGIWEGYTQVVGTSTCSIIGYEPAAY
jgi:hypothetical protein